MTITILILGAALSYLVGAIPFGLIVARIKGVDILSQGSGNIGATNVGRVLGRGYGLLVFFLDLLKGALPAWVGMRFLHEPVGPEMAGILTGAAAFLGHLFPLYLGFKGGKGVATGAGVMLVLVPIPFAFAIVSWLALVSSSRMVSLGSLISTLVLVVLQGIVACGAGTPGARWLLAFTMVAAAFVWIKHLANIRRIFQGTENKVQDAQIWHGLGNLILLLSLGIWLGSYCFFTFVIGPGVFHWFETAVLAENRPYWLMVPEAFQQASPQGLPVPLAKEQASRLAGLVVGPVFKIFYALQVSCALFALLGLVGKSTGAGCWKMRRQAILMILLAALSVGVNWSLLGKTEEARIERAKSTDAYLLAPTDQKPDLQKVLADRGAFGKIHGVSLLVNFSTGIFLLLGVTFLSFHREN